nr:unnamed protein product [Digitaria exilis]
MLIAVIENRRVSLVTPRSVPTSAKGAGARAEAQAPSPAPLPTGDRWAPRRHTSDETIVWRTCSSSWTQAGSIICGALALSRPCLDAGLVQRDELPGAGPTNMPRSRVRRRLGISGRRRVARVLVEVDDEVLGRVAVAALLHLLGGPAVALGVEAAPVVVPACARTQQLYKHRQKHRWADEKDIQKLGSSPSSAVSFAESDSGELVARFARRRRPVYVLTSRWWLTGVHGS